MPFFSAVAAGVGAAFAFATSTVVGQLLTGVAFNALASALFAPEIETPQSGAKIEREVRQGIVPRSFVLGRTATAGSLVYHNTCKVQAQDDENENYVAVYALSDLPLRGLRRMWIDGVEVTLGQPPAGRTSSYGYNRIPELDEGGPNTNTEPRGWYKFYDGTHTAADSLLVDRVSSPGRSWGSDAVGVGIAYVVLVYDFDPDVYSGIPVVLFEVDGIELTPPAGTPAGAYLDKLPAAQIYNILRGIEYNGQWLYGPQVPPILDDAHWAKAIADCKLAVPGAENWSDQKKLNAFGSLTVPSRYRAGLEVQVDRDIADTISDLASACNGRSSEVAGAMRFQVGDPPPPGQADFAFTDEDILTTEGQEFTPFLPLAETVNAVTAVYPDPDQQYQDQEPKPLYVPAYESDDGNRRLTTTARLDAVPYREQVQRLMRSALAEARRARRHSIVMPPRWWVVEPGDYGRWNSARNGYDNKMFRVDGVQDMPNGDIALDLTEVDPSDYDFDAEDYVESEAGSLIQPGTPSFDVPNWAVSATSIPGEGGSGRRPAIRISWDTERFGRGIIYRVFLGGTNTVVSAGSTDDYASGELIISEGILSLTTYAVEGRRIVRSGRAPWSPRLQVTTGDFRLTQDDLAQSFIDKVEAADAAANAAADSSVEALARSNEIVDNLSGTVADMIANYAALDSVVQSVNLVSDDLSGFEATVQQTYATQTAVDQAVAAGISQYDASVSGGLSASVTDIAVAQAETDGFLQAYAGVTVQTSGGRIAGFRATSFTDPDGTGGSALLLDGDQIIAPGTTTLGTLIVADGTGNMIPDPNFRFGNLRGWPGGYGSPVVVKRDPNSQFLVNRTAPSRYFMQFPPSSTGQRAVALRNQPVKPGQRISMSYEWSSGASVVLRMEASYLDENGGKLGDTRFGPTNESAGAWTVAEAVGVVPDGAVLMEISAQCGAGNTSSVQVANFSAVVQRTGATLLTPNSVSTAELAVNAVTAVNIDVVNLSSISSDLGTIKVDRGHITDRLESDNWSYVNDENFNGTRLDFKNGNAFFSGVVISRQMQLATGTFNANLTGPNNGYIGSNNYRISANTSLVDTGIDAQPWVESKKTIIATAGLTGSVSTDNTNASRWGFTAKVLNTTNFSGPATVHLLVDFHCQNVKSITGNFRWRVYEVT